MPNIEALREHIIPFRKVEQKEVSAEKIADTLVIFGEIIDEKKSHAINITLDARYRFPASAAALLLRGELADRAFIVSSTKAGLSLLQDYFDDYGVPEKSIIHRLSSGLEDEAKELHELAKDSRLGKIAVLNAGRLNAKTAEELKAKGISIDSFALRPEDGKRIVEKTRIRDLGKLFVGTLRSFKSPEDVHISLLSPSHA